MDSETFRSSLLIFVITLLKSDSPLNGKRVEPCFSFFEAGHRHEKGSRQDERARHFGKFCGEVHAMASAPKLVDGRQHQSSNGSSGSTLSAGGMWPWLRICSRAYSATAAARGGSPMPFCWNSALKDVP